MNNWIDIHSHLDDNKLFQKSNEILKKYFSIKGYRLISTADPYNIDSITRTSEILTKYQNLYAMIAAHPHLASEYSNAIEKRIIKFQQNMKCVALGETGLDLHYNLSPKDTQIDVFKRQIAIAKELKKPLLIHSRKAESEIIKILFKEKFTYPVIFHCYTGSLIDARNIINQGYYLSFSGIITFPNARDLRDVLANTPINQMFFETDSPYLTPEPHRGTVNSPLFIPYIYNKAAEILRIDLSQLQQNIIDNYHSIWP